MKRKLITLSLAFLALFSTLSAQQGTLTGTVKSVDGVAVQYVTVGLKGTSKGAITDKNGFYQISEVEPGSYTLAVSFVGMETQEKLVAVKAGEVLTVNFILKETSMQIGEVVISSIAIKADTPSQSLRVSTPLLQLPQNIQIVSAEVIKEQQVFDMLEGVQRNISGAQRLEHWDSYARINMRGSQLTAFRNGINVQLSPWSPLTEDMSIVERIEFVKGPAGFMLANGQPGGFYNVVTKKPTGTQKGEVTFALGSFDTYRSTVDLDGKLSKNGKLLYRLNVMGQLKGSHRDFEYSNRYTIAPVIKYVIDDKSSLTVEYTEQFLQMSMVGSNYAFSTKGYGTLPVNFTTTEPNLAPTNMNDRSLMVAFNHKINNSWTFTAQAGYLHFKQVGQSIWPWSISMANDSIMQRGISIWDALGTNKNGQLYVNGKVKTGAITHNILAGLDMSHRDYYADWNQGAALGDSMFNIYDPKYGTIPASEVPQWNRTQDIRERGVRYNNSYAGVYVQDEIGFFNNLLRLTLAGRYTTNNYINPYSGTSNDGKFTPRTGLSWSINRTTTSYVVYDEVFLGTPGTDWQGKNFKPIVGSNLEWGMKKDWMGGRWNTAVSAYQITQNNVLTSDLEHPDPVTGQFIYSTQTGQQQVKGVEVDVKGEIVKNLQVVVNYAFTEAVITKDSRKEVVGNSVAGATKHIQNTWLTYKFAGKSLNGIRLSLGYQYQAGRSSWFVFDNSQNSLPDYFRLDGGIGHTMGNLSVNLLVNNILNEYLYSGAPYGNMYYWQTEPKRNYRINIGYRF